MKVLITGANGFIGQHVTNAFQGNGDDVTGTDLQPNSAKKGIRYFQADVAAYEEMETLAGEHYDAVVHLAACLQMNSSTVFHINTMGTYHVLKVAQQVGCETFLHLSSIPVIGTPPSDAFISEDTPARPLTLYHISKYAAEQVVMLPAFEAIRRYNLRIASPVGPGMPNSFVKQMLQAAKHGKPLTLYGTGSRIQNYIDARDIARALVTVSQSKPPQGLYLLGGESYSNFEAARLCSAIANTKSEIVFLDRPDPADTEHWLIDDEKAKTVFGYSPRYTLRQSLLDSLE